MLNALLWNLLLTTGLAIVLTALCRLPSMRRRPALRYWLWLLLLAKLVTPPLISVPLLPPVAGSDGTAAIPTPPSKPTGHRASPSHRRTPANPAVDDTTSALVDEGAGRDVGRVTSRELRSGTQVPYLGGLLAVSLIGTCVLSTVHGIHAAKLSRWLRRAGTENSLLAETCDQVASRLKIRGVVRSCVIDARTTPLLWGWRRPFVVVPRQLMDDLSPQQLRSIVAHELAHLLRRDHWANVFVFVVKGLLWWNPVVWWADRQLRAAQELCCDAIAIDRCTANRRSYAATLFKALDFIQAEPLAPRALVPGMGSRGSILRRFEMIGETRLSYQLSRCTLLILLALVIPLVCIPVRGQEEGPALAATPVASYTGVVRTAADAGGKKAGTLSAPQQDEKVEAQTERVVGERPRGNCSISGKVISAATGKPVDHARMYLFYLPTHGALFVDVASDGTFLFKDIPGGPFSLRTTHTAGYQDAIYNPEGKSGPFPQFSLEEGEHRAGIVLKVKPACRISGKILEENGKTPENIHTLHVLAWTETDEKEYEGYQSEQGRVNQVDGSYSIDGLGGKPAYVMVIDWQAAKEGNAYPPIYYPGTFFRSDAKLITFDEQRHVDNVNIRLQKEGGLILEGTVIDETGRPVPEAFVVVHRRDMLFDFVTAYTDEQGRYQIQGLGDGEFLVHVDAVHRGFVRTRTPIDLDRASKKTQQDFTLRQGATISGKFVDQEGNDWQIGRSYGFASIIRDQPGPSSSFSLTGFWNKYRPKDVASGAGGSFAPGEGDYVGGQMLFPTKSTFIIQGMMPGHTVIGFLPNKEGQKVVKILYDGRNIMASGIETKPGQEIKGVTIVIAAQ